MQTSISPIKWDDILGFTLRPVVCCRGAVGGGGGIKSRCLATTTWACLWIPVFGGYRLGVVLTKAGWGGGGAP